MALLVLLVYWPTLSSGFVALDDFQYVVDNKLVRDPGWNSLRRFFTEVRTPSTVDGYYQPLTMTSLMLDFWLSGEAPPDPFAYHLTNILLHAATTVLVMLLVRECVGGIAVPVVVALLFALHPMQVESVAWISQRKTVLSGLLAVGCLICYLRYSSSWQKGTGSEPSMLGAIKKSLPRGACPLLPDRRVFWLIASVALYALGGLAKPTLMLLPLTLFLLDVWPAWRRAAGRGDEATNGSGTNARAAVAAPRSRSGSDQANRPPRGTDATLAAAPSCRTTSAAGMPSLSAEIDSPSGLRNVLAGLPGKLPFLVCMAAMMWVAWVSQASSAAQLMAPNVSSAKTLARLASLICYNLMLYVGTVFWPANLSPYHDLPADLSLANPAIVASIPAALAVMVVGLIAYRRSKPLFVGGLAFLVLLAPALGAIRFVETCVADRFLYLPSVFLTLPLAASLARAAGASRRRTTAVCAGAVLLAVGCSILTWQQQGVWRDSRSLWTRVIRTAPTLPKGFAQLAASDLEAGDFGAALVHARRAMDLAPEEANYMLVLGRAMVRTGLAADAIPVLRKAIEKGLGSVEPLAHLSLAEALLVAGDGSAAHVECARAITMGRSAASTYKTMGDAAMQFARDYASAAEYFRAALEHDPSNAMLRWNYGTALEYCGRDAEALREYEQAIAACRQSGLPTNRLESAAAALRDRLKGREP